YREDKQGQILEEGINEAGAFSSWIAAATSYSHSNEVTVPFYIFYSMFGLQRVGDLAWAAADQRARGFLLGATAGRTTLNGEGLYLLRESKSENKQRVQLMGSGTILREVEAAAELLEKDWGVSADVWSATSFTELRRSGLAVDRWNLLHPESKPRTAYVTECL